MARAEVAEAGGRLPVVAGAQILDRAAELPHTRSGRLDVLDREKMYGLAPGSPPWMPPGTEVWIAKPPCGPTSKCQPNSDE